MTGISIHVVSYFNLKLLTMLRELWWKECCDRARGYVIRKCCPTTKLEIKNLRTTFKNKLFCYIWGYPSHEYEY
jgi:hypothetical protein